MTSCNEVNPATESEKPKKCSCKCKAIVAAVLVVLIAGVVCWHVHRPNCVLSQSIAPKVGARCDVIFFGENTSLSGTLIAIDHEAIILEVILNPLIQIDGKADDKKTFIVNPDRVILQYWIPKSSIKRIGYESPNPQ